MRIPGVDVLPALPPDVVVRLLARFTQLAAKEQRAFLEALNAYLYTSPQQRRRLRAAWSAAEAAGDAQSPPANATPGPVWKDAEGPGGS